MKKFKLVSIVTSVVMFLFTINSSIQFKVFKVNAAADDIFNKYNIILDEFNDKYGTSYQMATDKQLYSVGINKKDIEEFYSDMSDEEFYMYIFDSYHRDNERSLDSDEKIHTNTENSETFEFAKNVNIIIPYNQIYSGKQKYYYYGSSSEYLFLSSTWGYGDGDYRYNNSNIDMGFACTEGHYPYYASYNTSHSLTNEARDMFCTYYCHKFIGYGIIDATNWTINVTFHAGRGDIWNYAPI